MKILVHLKLLWLYNDFQFKALLHLLPFGHDLKGEFWESQILGDREELGVGSCADINDFPIPLTTKFCSICRSLAGIPMSNFTTPRLGVRVDFGMIKMVTIEIQTQHSYSTSIHTIGLRSILHRLATIHNTADRRQSDRYRPPMQ